MIFVGVASSESQVTVNEIFSIGQSFALVVEYEVVL
jgi:hypothetical protein